MNLRSILYYVSGRLIFKGLPENFVMMKSIFPIAAFSILVLFSACGGAGDTKSDSAFVSPFNRDSLKSDLRIIASDSFQGRKPFSKGEDLTLDYLQHRFSAMGLEPGNGTSYLQDVPLVEISLTPDPTMTVTTPKGNVTLQMLKDYVLATERTDSVVSFKNDELVFAGYGVVAPEANWNDYAGLDVKGKVVLVMVNDPGFGTPDTTLFKGKTMTYYGRWTYKYEEAARQGAKGCLIIHNSEAASYPFSVVQSSWGGSSNMYMDTRQSPEYHCALNGWVSADAAKRILAAAGKDSSLLMSANKPGFHAVALNEKLSTSVRVKSLYRNSKNVIAKITGTKRPDEYIIYTAHWDHFGIGKKDSLGDSIYNGALDNGSGTAALLEMARAFKKMNPAPERSIVFLAVTAEEQGLLGSAYYGTHPVYPLSKTVADLNMDVVNAKEPTKDIVISGMGQNELENYVDTVAHMQGRYLAAESHPEAGHYFRSDHFSFAKQGVPALSVGSGVDVAGKGKEYGKKEEMDYTLHHYHQPSDNYDDSWTFDGGLQDMDLLYLIGKKLAAETSFPAWKTGSEFKAIREKSKR